MYTICVVVAGTGGIHKVVGSIAFDYKRCFEEIGGFGIGDEAGFGKTL